MRSLRCISIGISIAAGVAVGVVAPRAVAAQRLGGVVLDSVTRRPVPGAVVSLVDSSGRALARTIAGASGEFAFARSGGAALASVRRIGYRPRDLSLTRGAASLEVLMVQIPKMLEPVSVAEREICPGSEDGGAAFELWDQVRAGLLATVVARDANPASTSALVFSRRLPPRDEYVEAQRISFHRRRTSRPFVATEAPLTLARNGYMAEAGSRRTYFGPDADVLIDQSFTATHCFHRQAADAAHPGQVGLAFTPAPRRSSHSRVDVTGVIWVDPAVPQLRSLDFRYTALEPAAERVGSGGHVEFRTMPNGIVFVEAWTLRVANLNALFEPLLRASDKRYREDRTEVAVTRVEEQGGQVLSARWGDGTSWKAPATGIAGTVVRQGGAGTPAKFALLLPVDGDTTRADSSGAFSLVPLPPGRYHLTVMDTTLRACVRPRTVEQTVDVERGRVTTVRVEVPAPSRDRCR